MIEILVCSRVLLGRLRDDALRAVVLLVLAGLWAAPVLRAEPVLTLVIGTEADGSRVFADDLAAIWSTRNGPTPERLAVDVEPDPRRRLAALRRGRGEFALLRADEAVSLLPDYPRAKAIAVLWPLYLHALTRHESVQAVRLPPPTPIWALESARYAYEGLWEWTQNGNVPKDRLELFPSDWVTDALSQLRREILLLSAPAPLSDLGADLARDARLRLLPFDPALLEEFRVTYPWLRTATLPQGGYPGMRAPMELPARHMVMVGSVELGEPSVAKMLDTVYGTRGAAAAVNPLFAQMRPESNAGFSPLLPYHPAAAAALGLVPKEPQQ